MFASGGNSLCWPQGVLASHLTLCYSGDMSNLRLLPKVQDCDVCGRETGNLAKHRPACARKAGRVPATVPLTLAEDGLILRAGTHAAHEHLLSPQARLQGGVRNLDIAHVVLFVERGGLVWPSDTRRTWHADGMPIMRKPSLTLVVNEGLRLGILRTEVVKSGTVYRTLVTTAPTHLQGRHGQMPACGRPDRSALRYRLLDSNHLAYVDCQACLDKHASAIVKP